MARILNANELASLSMRVRKADDKGHQHRWFNDDEKAAVLAAYEAGKDYVKLGRRMFGIYERLGRPDVVFIKPLNGEFTPCGEINLRNVRNSR